MGEPATEHILECSKSSDEVEILENNGDPAPASRGHGRYVGAVKPDPS